MAKLCTLILLALAFTGKMAEAQQAPSSPLPRPDANGFIALFNGQSLAGWTGLQEYWSVIDGTIGGHENKEASKQTFLVRDGLILGDFELHVKYRFMSVAGNSGIQFRSKVLDKDNFRVGGYQADFDAEQIFDGSIYDEAGVVGNRGTMSNRGEETIWNADDSRRNQPLKESRADLQRFINRGDWNDVILIAQGPHIVYSINGHVMTDLLDLSPMALQDGVLALQLHEGFTMDVRFKDIQLKILKR